MFFQIIERGGSIPNVPGPQCFLRVDNWDDWGKFQTQFYLSVIDEQEQSFDVGSVKIGQSGLRPGIGQAEGARTPALGVGFDALSDQYFSVGQDETYYETLDCLSDALKQRILTGLRDCAFDLDILERMSNEQVMSESLLRSISRENIRNRLHRLAHGNAVLTGFEFEYIFPVSPMGVQIPPPPPTVTFTVQPNSFPPTNVHVLIGRNGVGKSLCMQNMAKALLGIVEQNRGLGQINLLGANRIEWSFSGLVSVSFSAFETFDLPESAREGMTAKSVGLRVLDQNEEPLTLAMMLARDFCVSFTVCRTGKRRERWITAVDTLSTDPLFADANIHSILDFDGPDWIARTEHFFDRLSSGHKIVLLTITKLVESVDERTIVLIDEPEVHLHPPLLSAFVRALANLLLQRNGIAIVATHSPVVLQEVPRSCVWKLRRSGAHSVAERPAIETFGENVGTLTREIFGLEVTSAGFHQLLQDTVDAEELDFDSVVNKFNGQLGGEARAILKGMISNRDSEI